MKTIEIKTKNKKEIIKILKDIRKDLIEGTYFHYFFEPRLIIRLDEGKTLNKIIKYLKKNKIDYQAYNYPFGRGYGEDKNGVVYDNFWYFKVLFWLNSEFVLRGSKENDSKNKIIERYNHTFLNQLGYEWEDEVGINLDLAKGRLGVIKRYDHSLAVRCYCSFLIFLVGLVTFLTRGLK